MKGAVERGAAGRQRSICEVLGAELPANVLLRVMQVGGHHVFKQDAVAGAGGCQREPAAQRAGSDDGDGLAVLQLWWHLSPLRWSPVPDEKDASAEVVPVGEPMDCKRRLLGGHGVGHVLGVG